MNFLKSLLLILLISTLGSLGLRAQNIDQERIQQDINIMENILQELFKTRWEAENNNVRVFSNGRANNITGTYLDDYGVLFTIIGGPPVVGLIRDGKGNIPDYEFQNASNDTKKVTKESITNRIQEFLQSYGSTISQLDNDDRITVIYKNNSYKRLDFVTIFSPDGTHNSTNENAIYTITATAQKTNLEAFRKGSITDDQFSDRMVISTDDDDEDKYRDLKIMANILKTTFVEADNDEFKIRGSVNHLYLDGLGALFNAGASYGSGFFRLNNNLKIIGDNLSVVGNKLSAINFDSLEKTIYKIKPTLDSLSVINVDSLKISPLKLDSIKTTAIKADSMRALFFDGISKTQREKAFFDGTTRKSLSEKAFFNDKNRAELEKERAEAYQKFLQQLKETMVDYGRTLKSVQSNEQILVLVSISNPGEILPERVNLSLKKSVLNDYDKGNLSREQAMAQITVREY